MKARPILFSAPMILALLEGRKTQTRRVVKHKNAMPPLWATFGQELSSLRTNGQWTPNGLFKWSEEQVPGEPLKPLRRWPGKGEDLVHDWYAIPCPYGKPGDLLWVRETWKPHSVYAGMRPSEMPLAEVFYRADDKYAPSNTPWVPAIHMPRWTSRLTLRITDVRVERLQDISEADAMAEGITRHNVIVDCDAAGGRHREITADRYFFGGFQDEGYESAAEAYFGLWDSINGKGAASLNDWIWVVCFEVIKANVDQVMAMKVAA